MWKKKKDRDKRELDNAIEMCVIQQGSGSKSYQMQGKWSRDCLAIQVSLHHWRTLENVAATTRSQEWSQEMCRTVQHTKEIH